MNWFLVITFTVNAAQSVIEVNSFNNWVCDLVASEIKEKTITINKHPIVIKNTECISH